MGTGEVGRYLGDLRLGPDRQGRLPRLAGAFLLKTDDNPDRRRPQEVFDGIAAAVTEDRYAYFTEFYQDFYNLDENLGTRISEEIVRKQLERRRRRVAYAPRSPRATWTTDFRADIDKIDVPGADPARHRRPDPADRRHRRARSTRLLPRTPTTSRSRAPRTACCGPTPRRSTTPSSPSWPSSPGGRSRAYVGGSRHPREAADGTSAG